MHGRKAKHDVPSDDVFSEINVIPFIDVCLVLLIIILMTAAADTKLVELSLPHAESTEYRDMNLAITLSVTYEVQKHSNGKPVTDERGKPKPVLDGKGNKKYRYYFEEEEKGIDPKNLWTALTAIQGNNKWTMFVIRVDKETPYEFTALALECAQSLGIEDINLAVKHDEAAEVAAN